MGQDARVNVVLPDGTPGSVPASAVAGTVADGGHVMTHAEALQTERAIKEEHDTSFTEHPLDWALSAEGAAATGWLRGVTFGLSDQAITKTGDLLGVGDATRDKLNAWRQAHPWLTASEELSGAAGGTALTFGEGAPVSGGALARIAEGSLRGGAEMGLYGAGKAVSEAALQNHDLTAEQILASAYHEGAMGLLGGAAFSTLGEAASGLRGAWERTGARLGEAGQEAAEGSLSGRIGDKLQQAADAHTIKAMGGSKGDVMALNETVQGGYQKVAQDVREYVKEATGKAFASKEEMHQAVTQGVKELGDKQTQMLRQLDKAKVGITPDAESFVKKVQEDVLSRYAMVKPSGELVAAPGAQKPFNKVQDFLNEIREAAADKPPTFEQWHDWRVNLDKMAYSASRKGSPAVDALRQTRGIMEGHLEDSAEQAAQAMGQTFKANYQANKSLLRSLIKAEELTSRGVAGEVASNSWGLTSRMAGIAGAASGVAMHGIPGGAAMGLASGLAGKFVQSKGDVLAAELLDRAATIMGARRVAARAEAEVSSSVRKFLGGKAANDVTGAGEVLAPPTRSAYREAGKAAPTTQRGSYEQIEKQLTQIRANPVAATDRISSSLGKLPQHAPGVSQAMIATSMRAAEFLSSKLPPSRRDPYSLTPQAQTKSRASDAEVSRFMRYSDGVRDPLGVLKEARAGKLTREHIEAVKAVYPNLYDQIRTEVTNNLVDQKSELPYGKRIQLAIMLDIPTDRTLAPDFVQAIQGTFSPAEKSGAESPPPTLSRPLNVANALQTATQTAAREGLEK